MKEQTAVEWLFEQIPFEWSSSKGGFEAFKQAKVMEQEQMKEMYLKGIENYDPTFKKKSKWTKVDNTTKILK
jgi:hypothetical protein